MDLLLKPDGDLYLSLEGDIKPVDSVSQKIKIKLQWFEGEWRWNKEEGMPYLSELLIKNPDIDNVEALIREKIFEVDGVRDVKDVTISFDGKERNALIRFVAITDLETIKEEVKLQCQNTE